MSLSIGLKLVYMMRIFSKFEILLQTLTIDYSIMNDGYEMKSPPSFFFFRMSYSSK